MDGARALALFGFGVLFLALCCSSSLPSPTLSFPLLIFLHLLLELRGCGLYEPLRSISPATLSLRRSCAPPAQRVGSPGYPIGTGGFRVSGGVTHVSRATSGGGTGLGRGVAYYHPPIDADDKVKPWLNSQLQVRVP